ncbi:MAG: PEP-CTERM sorting domain-containing protein [Rubritalea sp.]|jgi:hypothetical protein|tara:strand:+ start:28734 stop:29420 length:687 start_codon:yes stop_codon:yes gene_type:complete
MKKIILINTICVSLSLCANAALTITSSVATRVDEYIGAGGGNADPDGLGDRNAGNANMLVGYFKQENVEDMVSIWAFQMTGTASGTNITDADFSVTQTGGGGNLAADAYVIRTAGASTILVSDYQTNAQLLMSNFNSSGAGAQSLDAGGMTNLISYLQTNWVENDYVFIGIKNQSTPTGLTFVGDDSNNFDFYTAGDNGGTLTLVVPEPSSTALLGLGGLALILRRRK